MKKRKRNGGVFRLFITIIVLVAAVALIRLAVGKIASAGTKTKTTEQVSSSENLSSETVSSAGSSVLERGAEISLASGGDGAVQSVPSEPSVPDAAAEDAQPEDAGTEGATSASAAPEEEKPAYDHVATELEDGQEYLSLLEQRTPVEMEYMIAEAQKEHEKEVRREEYRKKREAYRETLDGDHVWEAFDDYVFLGDSRVVGYNVFGFLPSERILAEAGDTINAITDRMDTVKNLSPKYIFISYGINDIGIGFWPTKEEYAAAFSEKLHALQQALPDAEIYVNSIIPARDDAAQIYTIWQGLPEYSEAVRQMCEKEGFAFIDNNALLEEYSDLYATDGVHMQSEFYRYWAENQLLAVFDRENGLLTF